MATPTLVATEPDFAAVSAALHREWELVEQFVGALSEVRWHGPTACADWSVLKVVSHLTSGAEIHRRTLRHQLEGEPPLAQQERQALWDRCDSLAPEPLFAEFHLRVTEYLSYLDRIPEADHTRRIKAMMGELTVAQFAQYRLAEMALHSWDIRVALDPTARLLPATAPVHLAHVLAQLSRRSSADARKRYAGSSYAFELTGPAHGRFTLLVKEDGLDVQEGEQKATTTLRLPAEAFCRLPAGRLPMQRALDTGEIDVAGDRNVALALNDLFPGY